MTQQRQVICIKDAAAAYHIQPWQVSRLTRLYNLQPVTPDESPDRRGKWFPKRRLQRIIKMHFAVGS